MLLDGALARRIEAGEAANAAACGEFIEVGGGFASFAGAGSPLTHAIGLGLNGPMTPAEMDKMEEFYRARGAVVNLDLCPHADWTFIDLLGERGYRIVECNNVMAGAIVGAPDSRVAMTADVPLWTETMLRGFFARDEFSEMERDLGPRLLGMENASAWVARVNGEPSAAGAMNVRGRLALLFADSTIEKYRGQGLHVALIRARLKRAAELGCDLATASTMPGSISQRNYERAGFRVAYTKLNMQRSL